MRKGASIVFGKGGAVSPRPPLSGVQAGPLHVVPPTPSSGTRRNDGERTWRQYLKVTKLGKQTYYDEGDGGVVLEP